MEIKSVAKKGQDSIVIGEITKIFKYKEDLQEIAIPDFDGIKSIINESEDCYIIFEQGNTFDVIRIGAPEAVMILKDSESRTFREYDINNNLINSSSSLSIGHGYYIVSSINPVRKGFFENSGLRLPFDFNYLLPKEPVSNTDGYNSDGVFTDVGFATFGYIGKRFSKFDLEAGVWVDSNTAAKASDIAMAVCKKYNLEWYDNTQENYIQNYIRYFRSYDEENGVFRVYAPGDMFVGGTPIDNPNNFELIREDEFENTYISGVDMLSLKDLETAPDGSKGILIPYI